LAFCTAENPYGLLINLKGHRIGVSVLAAMGEGKTRRIGEAAGRPMHDFRHHRESLYRARTNASPRLQHYGEAISFPHGAA